MMPESPRKNWNGSGPRRRTLTRRGLPRNGVASSNLAARGVNLKRKKEKTKSTKTEDHCLFLAINHSEFQE